jgi:N-acetyl-anhydromuramyl-L-alanine amidase AmpD
LIPSPFHSARGTQKVRLVVVHTAEGASTVEALGAWFQKSSTQASSHAGIDDNRVETYVPYTRSAWTLRSGNAISDNVELCGWARWSREEWLSHDKMIRLTAAWIRGRCIARNIPIRKLTPAQVAGGQAGVIGHVDWTVGMRDGSHTDPGPKFPWDIVIDLAIHGDAPVPAPAATTYCRKGDRSDQVMKLQKFMTSHFASYNRYNPTGYYGDQTAAGMAEFQKRTGITGPDADGTIVGPRTMAQLTTYGFQP